MMKRINSPTLLDVARLAGVSTATVSRCLNFPDQVSNKAKMSVHDAIGVLGYAPNFGAKAMAARRTHTIGAVIPTMENAIFARGLQAFQETLREQGFTMLIASTSYSAQIEEEQIRALVARGADALLLIGHDRAPEIYDFLKIQSVPVMVTWAFDAAAGRASVGFDNYAAMQALAARAIGLGHRKIAFISAPMAENDRARGRYEGLCAAMVAGGLDPADLALLETHYGIDNGAAALETLMRLDPRPTMVFCGNDVLAVGAVRRAKQMGLLVPDTVSITGFDDIELAQISDPPLTTVHVPHREMGRRAALALVAAVTDGVSLQSVELPATIVMRESLAAPSSEL
ncbi:LacI family DNA-binding transcriptional regulator [Yoonia sp. MH D7]